MCFHCLVIREESLSNGVPHKYMKYWCCQKNMIITERNIERAKEIKERLDNDKIL